MSDPGTWATLKSLASRWVSQREADFGPNRRRLSPTASSHDHQRLVSITGVHLLQAIERAKLAAALKHQPNTPLHHWHHLSQSRLLDESIVIGCLPLQEIQKLKEKKKNNASCTLCVCSSSPVCVWLVGGDTLLLDLSDLPHSLLENSTFVRLDVEAVNVREVSRDELSQFLDVLALLLPPTLVTPAGEPKGIRHVTMTTFLPMHCPSL